ncbi:MAG: preprotein translocase subunit SecG [Burkholderiales bacterium]|jgi:preprotein translocase subunit SecG|nr:preprotein translocase subunit SecG [Burkholderiales bacterium]
MSVWHNFLFILQVLSAMAMIGLVLIQHGKGADMGASFGSGASGSLFGATGSANFLSRSTAICATVFFATTLGMSVLSTGRGTAAGAEINSRLDIVSPPAVVASAPVRAASGAASSAASAAIVVPASAPSGVQGVPTR